MLWSGAWQIDDDGDDASSGRTASGNAGTCANKPVLLLTLLAGPEYQAILKAEKVFTSIQGQTWTDHTCTVRQSDLAADIIMLSSLAVRLLTDVTSHRFLIGSGSR